MPPIKNRVTGEVTTVSDEMAADLVRSGEFDLADGGAVETRAVTGGKVRVGGRQLRGDRSLEGVGVAEQAEALKQARRQREYGDGVVNKLQAFGGGVAKGLSFGFANPWENEQEFNSGIAGAGEFVGVLAPAILTAGGSAAATGAIRGGGTLARALALTPSGLVARGGARIAARTAGAGGAKAVAGLAAAGAFEGAAGNAGYYLSSVANGDKELSAEGFVGSLSQGALWGGGAGGAFGAAERGFVRARSMFPRLAGGKATKAAADAAESTFATQTDEVMAAADDMIAAAKQKIRDLKVPKAQANLALAQAMKAGDKSAADAARSALRDINVQAAEARLTLAGGKPAPAAALGDAPTVAAPPTGTNLKIGDTEINIPTPPSIVDDAVPAPVFAEGSGASKQAERLEGALANFEARKADVGAWLQAVRGKADAGRWVKRTAQDGQWARGNADLHVDIVGQTPDEILAWRRPHIDDITVREDYDELIRKAAGGIDEATRKQVADLGAEIQALKHAQTLKRTPKDQLAEMAAKVEDLQRQRVAAVASRTEADSFARQAAELEVQALDAAPNALNKETLAARARLGTDPVDLARRRILRDIDNIAGMEADDVAYYVTGARHPNAGKVRRYEPVSERGISQRAGDDQFAAADAAMMREGGSFDGVVDDATARVNRWKAEGKLDRAEKTLAREGWRTRGELPEVGRLVDETEQGAEVIGAFERANADLAAELGTATPAKAKALADDYGKAIDDQARKSTERIAQVADDAATAPAKVTRKGKAKEVASAAGEEETSSRMGMLGDLAGAAEWLQAAGVAGIPDVDKIPVVGPLLSMFLKVRSARAMVGGLGGRVPSTVEAKIAGKAAQVRDRAAAAVDRMLTTGAKVTRVGRGGAAIGAGVLAHRLFDDGETRGKPANDGEAVRHRVAELSAAAADPDAVKRAVRAAMRDAHDPDMVRAVEAAVLRKLQYLAKHMPKAPPPSLLGGRNWTPSKVEIDKFARRVKAAEDPASVFEDLADGTVTPEAAETLREVYPQLFAEAQMRLVERAAEVDEMLPYQRVIKLSVLFDVPLVPSMRPERIAAYQQGPAGVGQQSQQQPQPSMSGPPPNLDSLYMSSADRRAQRR